MDCHYNLPKTTALYMLYMFSSEAFQRCSVILTLNYAVLHYIYRFQNIIIRIPNITIQLIDRLFYFISNEL